MCNVGYSCKIYIIHYLYNYIQTHAKIHTHSHTQTHALTYTYIHVQTDAKTYYSPKPCEANLSHRGQG